MYDIIFTIIHIGVFISFVVLGVSLYTLYKSIIKDD
jgi:hypothetical protein